jgi:hypothetical protein
LGIVRLACKCSARYHLLLLVFAALFWAAWGT